MDCEIAHLRNGTPLALLKINHPLSQTHTPLYSHSGQGVRHFGHKTYKIKKIRINMVNHIKPRVNFGSQYFFIEFDRIESYIFEQRINFFHKLNLKYS